ncbi:purine/pyrimidine permease [Paenibacillus sp. MZ04-78.2]|uniref:purine/pyrimidine permease n=1 Tax=Paenibacillus sp. MZ04-78.2 TaxID=2962034 RepID=UPI0020B65D86|nr:purine/pyrimidine permease [Paenibacillus sp. MZ04-78.2]MCP3774655.1 purine/pyrimidine permease [Paenibacillus sp. MZ04-78.2]
MRKLALGGSLSTLQWFMFLLASSISLPIVIGGMFHLSPEEISSLMQRTFLVVGLSSFLQGWIGHRYPIADGPAGSWVSVFVIMADVAVKQGGSARDMLPLLEGGVAIAALLLVVLGLTGWVHKLLFLFTPLVTGTFLFLLALQLSGVFVKGMLGLQGAAVRPDPATALVSIAIFGLVLLLSLKGRGWVKQYAVMIGIISGWAGYGLLGLSGGSPAAAAAPVQLPELFAWGAPQWDAGIALTAALFTFILLSNTIAAVTAVRDAMPPEPVRDPKRTLNRGVFAGGLSHGIAALFSTIAVVPLPVTAGFIRITEQTRLRPFLVAALLFAGISFVPAVVRAVAMLPGPVASAALLASFVQMIVIAMQSISKEALDLRRLTIFGITLVCSVGLMFLPAEAFQGLPPMLAYVFGNALLFGTILVTLLEQLWRPAEAGAKSGLRRDSL